MFTFIIFCDLTQRTLFAKASNYCIAFSWLFKNMEFGSENYFEECLPPPNSSVFQDFWHCINTFFSATKIINVGICNAPGNFLLAVVPQSCSASSCLFHITNYSPKIDRITYCFPFRKNSLYIIYNIQIRKGRLNPQLLVYL